MSCKLITKDLESVLYDKLVKKFGEDIAVKKAAMFESDSFIKEFGDYIELMENKSEFIPPQFNGRLNEKFEPELFEDETGMFYLDSQFSKQYIDIAESKLYETLQSQRAVNSLVEILANNYIEQGGFGLDFDTLTMSDNKSEQSLLESIKSKLEELGLSLIESENDDIATNGGVLFSILEDEDSLNELVSKIKDFYKSRQLIYKEDYSRENVDIETEEQRDPIFNQASFKVNPKNKVTSMVKIRLSMIKNPTDLDEDFGQPKSIDYGSLYNKMTAILKDNPVTIDNQGNVENIFETIIDKLKAHSNNIKYLSNVAEYLEKINRLPVDLNTKEGINTFNFISGFVNVMNLQKNVLEYSEVLFKEVVVVPAVTEERTLANGAIKKVVIKEAIMGKEYIYDRRDATKDTKVEKNILTNWGLSLSEHFDMVSENGAFTMNKESFKKTKERLEAISKDVKLSNKEKALIIFEKVLPHVGININQASFNFAINELKEEMVDEAKLDQNYYNFVKNTVTTFDSLLKNFTEKKDIFNTYWYRQLAKAEAFYREDGSESSVFTAGETRYIYSNPSYLHNTTNSWKKDRQILLDEYNNQGSFEKGSLLYEYLLGLDIKNNPELQLTKSIERISNFQVNHFSSFRDLSNSKSKQKTNKDVSKNEYIQDTINGLLHYHIDPKNPITHTRTTTAPGKSTQYNLQHGMFVESGFNIVDGVADVSTTSKLLFDKYLMAEFTRMKEQYEILQSNEGLKVYYHTNKSFQTFVDDKLAGNAFKSQLFPSLSFDKIESVINIDSKKPLYNKDGSIIFENIAYYKSDIINFIESKVIEHIEDLKNDLIKYNIIERSGENSYINRGIDSRIIKEYTKGDFNLNEDALFRMMGDLWLNGLVNHIEYSKLFSGDVAYYKDSVDYIKRIGATYTDGIYEYLSNINKDFKIGITESIDYVEPYLKELKEVIKSDEVLSKEWEKTVNAADAQAWITPKRWKSILLGVGKYTETHENVYKKLQGKNKEALTTEELKLVAQPLKGVYFGKDKLGSPIYLKYSQAVMLPQLRENSKLKDLFEFMEHHKVDELLTFDAIKAGSVIPTKVHTEDGKVDVRNEDGSFKAMNVMTINSQGWKLQQDLPIKTFKETDIGSQILKNMLLLISDKLSSKEKLFEHNGIQYTAEEFAKELDSTLGQLVAEGYNDLAKEFNISEDGVIGNVDKFYDALSNEIIDRDGSSEIAKALKAKLSIYALPGLKNKLDNIFASIVNDRTVKIKTNGGSFIQMSNFGLSKEEADVKHKGIKWSPELDYGDTTKPYTYKKDAEGNNIKNIFGEDVISPEQILISGSFIAKYIPNYEDYSEKDLFGTLNKDTGRFEGGMIDDKILSNIIGYRIPNQGPSSNGALQVVGILPAGVGDTIVAFTGITKKTGSDFDIDKMYVMFPNYNPQTNLKSESYKFFRNKFKGTTIKETIKNLRNVFPEIEDEKIAEALQSNETRVEFVKSAFDELVQYVLDNKSKPEVKSIIDELDIKVIKLKYIDSKGNSKKAKQNKVIELYKELILHQSNITKIMTPLDFEHVKQDAQNLAPAKDKSDLDNFEFIQDIITKYSFLAGLAGVGQEANTSSDYAIGTMADVYLQDVIIGDRAHTGKSFEVTRTNSKGEEYTVNEVHTKFDNIKSVELSDNELKQYLKSYNSKAPKDKQLTWEKVQSYRSFDISDNISALMNAFVDIAKDPYITNVNWNMMTTNTGNMMMRAGVHPFIVMSFLAQPIIGEYIDFLGQYETQDKSEQTSNSKDAFRIYKVGELIKDDLIHISNFEDGSKAEVNARSFYEIVTKYGYNLDTLEAKDFSTTRKLIEVSKLIGLPEKHKFTQEDFVRIQDQVKNILNKHKIFFTPNFKNYVINDNLGDIRGNVFKNDLSFQSRTFQTFLTFQGFAKKLKYSVDASKHSVNGIGKNTTQLLIAQNRIQGIENKGVINYNTKMYYPDGSPKFLAYLKKYNLDNTQKIVQNNPLLFVSSTPFVWNSYNKISQNIYGTNLEDDSQGGLGDKLDKTFNTYLMSGFNPFNMTNEEKTNLLENFPKEFVNFKNKYSNKYKVINELNIKQSPERLYIISTNKDNSKEYTDDMINSWREVIKYYPKFGENLVKYSFITSGFNNNTSSFFQFIPPSYFFQNNFNGYIKEFTKYPNSTDENFINHFYLSNLNDSQIVKYANKTQILKDQPFNKNKMVSFNKNITKDFISVKDTYTDNGAKRTRNLFYKRIGLKIVDGVEYNLYTDYIRVDGGYAKIKSLTSDKDGGITINNFNSERLSLPVDTTLTKEQIKALDDMINTSESESITTTQEDQFGQEDVVMKEDLSNVDEKGQISMFGNEVETIKKINIYAGTNENAELSNFAVRPFTTTSDIYEENDYISNYKTVEGAFQAYKLIYTDRNDTATFDNLNNEDRIIVEKLKTATGAQAKSIGRSIKGLNSKEWNNSSVNVMKDLLRESFEQNPKALETLLATGNAKLTHTQDISKWGTEFPKLLMEVREELKQSNSETIEKPTVKSKKDMLKSLFIKDTDNSNIAKGSVVNYKDKQWIVWNITDKGGAQLIDTEGNKFSGTPKLDKLSKIGDYTTTDFNGTDYIVTANENIYSLDTGKQVFTSLDGSTKSKKAKIINQIMEENDLESVETIYEQFKDKLGNTTLEDLKLIEQKMGTEYTIEYIKKCKG